MKGKYQSPQMDKIGFAVCDIIAASNPLPIVVNVQNFAGNVEHTQPYSEFFEEGVFNDL